MTPLSEEGVIGKNHLADFDTWNCIECHGIIPCAVTTQLVIRASQMQVETSNELEDAPGSKTKRIRKSKDSFKLDAYWMNDWVLDVKKFVRWKYMESR